MTAFESFCTYGGAAFGIFFLVEIYRGGKLLIATLRSTPEEFEL